MTYVSIHGKRFGLLGNGLLRVDNQVLKASAATLGGSIYVHSATGDDNHHGLTPDQALATLDAAFAKCTADKGWNIFVLPKHVETVTGAAGIAHDVDGVSVYGIGHGGQQPEILMDAGTSVTYKITAEDAYVSNINFHAGHSTIVTCIDIQTAKNAWIDGCRFTNNAASENFETCIKSGTTTDNECDGLTITNCTWMQVEAGSLEFYEMLGNTAHITMTGNIISHEGTGLGPLVLATDGDILTLATITDNVVRSKDTSGAVGIVSTNTATNHTGIVARNYCASLTTSTDRIVSGENAGYIYFDNMITGVVTTSGFILPARDDDL